jgi:hypothetical protein
MRRPLSEVVAAWAETIVNDSVRPDEYILREWAERIAELERSFSNGNRWIPLTDAARPTDGEHVWIAGYGFKGRFYAEAVYEHGEWLMFDQEVDRYCHPCEYPTFWSRINPIPQKVTKP